MAGEHKSFDLPQKVQGGWRVAIIFKTFEGAMEHLTKGGFIGANSAEQTVEVWRHHNVSIINREAKSLRGKFRKWFKL